MTRAWVLVALVSCGACGACGAHDSHDAPAVIVPTLAEPLPPHHDSLGPVMLAAHRRRMLPPEALLRAYLGWFGGLAPVDAQKRAHGLELFDSWTDYLAALGLPDYHVDSPRVTQSNSLMLATIGKLSEALCVRAAEHDLHARTTLDKRVVFGFDARPAPSLAEFEVGFDVLHRTFLSYPAPVDRAGRFYALYREVAGRHTAGPTLTSDETAWVAICSALVLHPEAGLY